MQINQIGQLTELQAVGGGYITEAYATNFHHKWTRKPLLAGESASDFREVTAAEWAAIEAADAKYVPPSDEFVRLVLATYPGQYWLRWNANTGYFSINPRMFDANIYVGFDDISVEEMMRIYNRTTAAQHFNAPYQSSGIRINLPPYNYGNPSIGGHMAQYNSDIEVLFLTPFYNSYVGTLTHEFADPKLRTIVGGLVAPFGSQLQLDQLPKLENCYFYFNNKCKILIPDSPLLAFPSLNEPIAHANTFTADNAPTLQVHADVYAKVTGDYTNEAAAALTTEERAQWLALGEQATAKNIIFTTA